jgi:hypothetical protein
MKVIIPKDEARTKAVMEILAVTMFGICPYMSRIKSKAIKNQISQYASTTLSKNITACVRLESPIPLNRRPMTLLTMTHVYTERTQQTKISMQPKVIPAYPKTVCKIEMQVENTTVLRAHIEIRELFLIPRTKCAG